MKKVTLPTNKLDLEKQLVAERAKLQGFSFASAGSKSTNVKEGKAVRKTIAQILTKIRQA